MAAAVGPFPFCEGLAPPALPQVGAIRPHDPRERALRPAPRVTFSPMRKSPKNLPEGISPLGTPLGGLLSSPQRRQAPLPPERGETPGSLQKPNLTAAPRIDSRGCDPRYSLRRNKDRFAHHLKVANRSVFVAQAHRGGAACRRGSEASPSGDSKGHSPWRAFGDFPRDGKVTRVQGGAPASRGLWGRGPYFGERRGAAPLAKN